MRALLVLAVVVSAGCFQASPDPPIPAAAPDSPLAPADSRPAALPPVVPTPTGAPVDCAHPYPCEDDPAWPRGLVGPFAVLPPENVTLRSFDGALLHGILWRPAVPAGVRVPVVVEATPYRGQVDPPGWHAGYMRAADAGGGYVFRALLENGTAVVIFSVRGTGESGGCFDFWGKAEQRDSAEMVAWAARAPWSNGRVAMYGLSYMGTTPWQAAIQAPPALKTIVVGGILTDKYLAGFTPQGAAWAAAGPYALALGSAIGTAPPIRGGVQAIAGWATAAPGSPCPDTTAKLAEHERSALVDDRDDAWYEERRLAKHLGNVTAAVLVTGGYEDGTAHLFQEDTIWPALARAPKHMVLGHWGHVFPTSHIAGSASGDDFRAYQLAWLDYWLKGVGPLPVGTGAVDYETSRGAWRVSSAWPPAERRDEVLRLAGGTLAPAPGGSSRTFVASSASSPEALVCAWLARGEVPPEAGLVYATAPAKERVELAGNAMAYLHLESSRPSGLVSVSLYRVPPLDWCAEADDGGAYFLTAGAADLRFHAGGYDGRDFPVGTRTGVRIDLWSDGGALEPGERLALVVTRASPFVHDAAPTVPPRLTLHPESELVLPLVAGTLGGSAPSLAYPPRPFAAG